jgi:hypothetical protein
MGQSISSASRSSSNSSSKAVERKSLFAGEGILVIEIVKELINDAVATAPQLKEILLEMKKIIESKEVDLNERVVGLDKAMKNMSVFTSDFETAVDMFISNMAAAKERRFMMASSRPHLNLNVDDETALTDGILQWQSVVDRIARDISAIEDLVYVRVSPSSSPEGVPASKAGLSRLEAICAELDIIPPLPDKNVEKDIKKKLHERLDPPLTKSRVAYDELIVQMVARQRELEERLSHCRQEGLAMCERVTALEETVYLVQEKFNFYGIELDNNQLFPKFNRSYGNIPPEEGYTSTPGFSPIPYGPEGFRVHYHCPNGWRRVSLMVEADAASFDAQYGNWHVGYHGTAHRNIVPILSEGFRVGHGIHLVHGAGIYFTPSIVYAQHPRYSKVYEIDGKFCQVILMCRINNLALKDRVGKVGTVDNARSNEPRCDPNYSNDELEFVLQPEFPMGQNYVIYGLMFRVLTLHPRFLLENSWIAESTWEAYANLQ